jgi:uncharacterized membrane protein YgdD (TMEM256/DUF423 family)
MRLNNNWMKAGALTAALGVVLGAFAPDALGGYVTETYAGQAVLVLGRSVSAASKYMDDFRAAAIYQLVHALAIVFVGLLMMHRPRMMLRVAGWCFLVGVVCFSGSEYLRVLADWQWLSPVRLIGGLLLVGGWVAVVEGACPGDNPRWDPKADSVNPTCEAKS